MQNLEQKTIKKNNRWTIVGLFVVFTAPLVIAYGGWYLGWFDNVGTSNHGELIQPVITLEESGILLEKKSIEEENLNRHWWIIFVSDDKHCGLKCQANSYLVNQARTAQAKELVRIEKLIISKNEIFTTRAQTFINEHFGSNVFATLSLTSPLEAGKIYLMDPLGNIFMYYPGVKDELEAVKAGKGIIKDLKKLLKISQIG